MDHPTLSYARRPTRFSGLTTEVHSGRPSDRRNNPQLITCSQCIRESIIFQNLSSELLGTSPS